MLTNFGITGIVQSFAVDKEDEEHGILRIQTGENEKEIIDVHVYDSTTGLIDLKKQFKRATIAKCEGVIETFGIAKKVLQPNNSLQQTELIIYRLIAKSMKFLSVKEISNDSNPEFKA